jgi:two-component system, NarL family, invasion response regulator UvrY
MSDTKSVQLLLVDDHAIVREGYRSLLSKQTGLKVIAVASDSAEAYRLYQQHHPDLVITDLSMPDASGIVLIKRIKQYDPAARILVFSMHQNPAFAAQAIRAGALGYVSKSSEPGILLRAIDQVLTRSVALSPDIAQALALEKLGRDHQTLAELTTREFEILRLLVEGKDHEQIADILHISPKTVCNSHYLIKSKLGVESDIQLTRLAIKLNVLDLLELIVVNAETNDGPNS